MSTDAEKNSGDGILNDTNIVPETLYLEDHHESLAIRSQIAIFVLNYCRSDVFHLLLCDPDVNETPPTICKSPSLRIPNELECDWLDSTQIPGVVLQSQLPSILTSDGLLCCVGLCIVLRRIVRRSHNKYPKKNLISLLGFQRNCLKGFAEGSSWTKYCEIELPNDVEKYLNNSDSVPLSIHKLNKCLSLPVKVANKKKHQRNLRKSLSDGKNKGVGISLEASSSSQESDMNSSSEGGQEGGMVKTNTIVTECSKRLNPDDKGLNHNQKDSSKRSKIALIDDSELSSGSGNISENVTGSEQKTKSKPNKSGEFLPQLEHTFAEGIDMTLIDLVIFPCVHLFLHQTMQSNHMAMFWKNHLVLMWYRRMWGLKEVKESAEACGMAMIVPTEDLLMIPSNHDEPELEIDVPNIEGTGMKEAKPISKRGMRMAIQRKAATLLETLSDGAYVLEFMDHPSSNINISWDHLPPQVHPAYGNVPDGRSERKCQQIENIVAAVKLIAEPGDHVVDFCSGGGHLGIVLATVLPECHIILVESKEVSLIKGLNRVKELGLENVTFYLGNIDYYHGQFNIGVSLHACGVATDMVITRCIEYGASFVSSPCCYGAVRDTHVITYPRSEKLRSRPLSFEDYRILAHAAEHTTWDFDSDTAKQAKSCMACIDSDRLLYASQYGYRVWMTTMQPFTCTPKNNLLIGVMENRQHKLQAI